MDKVRFGRALGYGARHAAKAIMSAADAATAPNHSPQTTGRSAPPASTAAPASHAAARAASSVSQARSAVEKARAVASQAPRASRSIFAPVKEFSSSLMLQVMGSIFSLFALGLGQAVWKLRASFHGPYNTAEAHELMFISAMFLMFTYFAISSFVRAGRKKR
ncbi:MAG TPA: hypothetical protein VGN16_21330 [Acidobacteriaceae bacterium]|jgi:hypothetical protein